MTGARKLHSGELIALRPGRVRVTSDADAPVHVSETKSVPGLGNVIPFLRPRTAGMQGPEVTPPADAARLPAPRRVAERARLVLFLALSLSVHGALLWHISREPEPLASIGVEVISAELVLGANESTGTQKNAGEDQVTSQRNDSTDPQQVEPQREATPRATEQPQTVQVGPQEAAPEREIALERQADEPTPADNAAAPREQRQPVESKRSASTAIERSVPDTASERETALERQADEPMPADNASEQRQPAQSKPAIAMVQSPDPEMATAVPREIPPDTMDLSLLPQPEEKPREATEPKPAETRPIAQRSETKPIEQMSDPKPVQAAPPKPVKNAAKAKERRRIAAPTREKATREAKGPQSVDALAGSGRGAGRSSSDTNYRGLVSAHLRRYKQYPSEARARGDRGSATVTFSLSGSGGVTSVRLARASGVSSIDQEVQAMVRRASPFPAPPDGRPVSFTVPVSFDLQ